MAAINPLSWTNLRALVEAANCLGESSKDSISDRAAPLLRLAANLFALPDFEHGTEGSMESGKLFALTKKAPHAGADEVVEALSELRQSLVIHGSPWRKNQSEKSGWGWNGLRLCVEQGDPETLKLLLNAQDAPGINTMAQRMVKIDGGWDTIIEVGSKGMTLLGWALHALGDHSDKISSTRREGVIGVLLAHGLSMEDMLTPEGHRAVDMARRPRVLSYMLENGLDVRSIDAQGNSALSVILCKNPDVRQGDRTLETLVGIAKKRPDVRGSLTDMWPEVVVGIATRLSKTGSANHIKGILRMADELAELCGQKLGATDERISSLYGQWASQLLLSSAQNGSRQTLGSHPKWEEIIPEIDGVWAGETNGVADGAWAMAVQCQNKEYARGIAFSAKQAEGFIQTPNAEFWPGMGQVLDRLPVGDVAMIILDRVRAAAPNALWKQWQKRLAQRTLDHMLNIPAEQAAMMLREPLRRLALSCAETFKLALRPQTSALVDIELANQALQFQVWGAWNTKLMELAMPMWIGSGGSVDGPALFSLLEHAGIHAGLDQAMCAQMKEFALSAATARAPKRTVVRGRL